MQSIHPDAGVLALLAASFVVATTHSLSPDHWFPFVMLGKAKDWRVSWVTALACLAGIGHVGTSVVIGLVGVFAKTATSKTIATVLEDATPVLLMIFGFGYAAYAIYRQRLGSHGHSHGIPIITRWLRGDPHAFQMPHREHQHHGRHSDHTQGLRVGEASLHLHDLDLHLQVDHDDHHHHYDATGDRNHRHEHAHGDVVHDHVHYHQVSEFHTHGETDHSERASELTHKKAGWALVAILGLTPCIALLPLTFASVKYGTAAIILVNAVFGVATIGTIVVLTWLGSVGLSWLKFEFFDKYGDIISGLIIGSLGVMTKVFEL